jgi:3-oxoacyl-[acyl-carrier protein] reductase
MWNESEEIEKFIKSMTPAGERIATPEDIADIVAMLCEEKARWITGSTTCANGGYLPT